MDVIARCAFGLKIDSLGDKDDPFIRNADFVFHPPTNKSPLILLPCELNYKFWCETFQNQRIVSYGLISFLYLVMYPKLFTMFGERIFVTEQLKFFFTLLENMLRERSSSKQVLSCLFMATYVFQLFLYRVFSNL